MKINYLRLIISVAICQLAGVIGSFFTSSSVSTWYEDLAKPSFNPPSWVFGPVWITIYFLMGISLYLVWMEKKDRMALSVFGVQLALNTSWSIFFFGMRNPLLAFVNIILLWAAIIAMMVLFWRISKRSAYLLIPYLLWVSFAAVLNLSFVILS